MSAEELAVDEPVVTPVADGFVRLVHPGINGVCDVSVDAVSLHTAKGWQVADLEPEPAALPAADPEDPPAPADEPNPDGSTVAPETES